MGRRVVNYETTGTGRPTRQEPQAIVGQYWDRLKNFVPAEVSAIYIAGLGVVPSAQQVALIVWALFCLICTAVFIANQSRTMEGKPLEKYPIDWIHVAISCISFLVWVYALGGPFAALGVYVPWLATLIMLGWTFIIPFVYKGTDG